MKIYVRPFENISSAATIIPDFTTLHLGLLYFYSFHVFCHSESPYAAQYAKLLRPKNTAKELNNPLQFHGKNFTARAFLR